MRASPSLLGLVGLAVFQLCLASDGSGYKSWSPHLHEGSDGSSSSGIPSSHAGRPARSRPQPPNDVLFQALEEFKELKLGDKPITWRLPRSMRRENRANGIVEDDDGEQEKSDSNEASSSEESEEEDDLTEHNESLDEVAKLEILTQAFNNEWERRGLEGEMQPRKLALKVAQLTLDLGESDMISGLALSRVIAFYKSKRLAAYSSQLKKCMVAIRYFRDKQGQHVTDARIALNLYTELRSNVRGRRGS